MHGWTRHATLAPLALVALLAGCNGDTKMNQQALLDENRDLRSELDRSRGTQDDAQARVRQLEFEHWYVSIDLELHQLRASHKQVPEDVRVAFYHSERVRVRTEHTLCKLLGRGLVSVLRELLHVMPSDD